MRCDRLSSGVEQQEAAGAVGVLRQARATGTPGRTAPPADRPRCRRSARARRRASSRRKRPTTRRLAAARRAGCRAAQAARRPSRRAWMSKSSVRLAFDASVTCVLPPVSCQTSQESIVPNASSPRARALAGARDVVEQPAELRAREIGVDHQPGLLARSVRALPAARSSSQSGAVRRSCQTIAFAIGRPVARSQTTVVSRWFVMPMAATSRARDAGLGERLVHDAGLRRPDFGRRRARPSRAAERSGGTPAAPSRGSRPTRSKTMARELVVP